MATMTSTTLSRPALRGNGQVIPTGFKAFWRQFVAKAFDPYRPELHYMRGPGPKSLAQTRSGIADNGAGMAAPKTRSS